MRKMSHRGSIALYAGLYSIALSAFAVPSALHAEDTSVATPNADGKVVFQDDFESGTGSWETLDPGTWELAERDGNHTLAITARQSDYVPPVRSPFHVALVKDLELESVEINFRVRSTKDTGNHRDCCVFFNYQDDQHFYYVHLGAKPDPHSGQIMIVNEAPRLAITQNEKPTPWDDDWHHVRVVRIVETGAIDVYFDDMETPHLSVIDKSFSKGRVGIGSFDDMNEFDDVVVSAR
ncbi:hypothetical protein [Aporhodopirellula aestuarii]|uniref:3-keto-disaccharide hydrolase domain-containing protein n=1 Tax=Aporhodopirellula aestuarii TaxID=2950107 RepID=A0ABT0U6I2_9BACT|nr:hypothetical protein [Aporhodopirellula aestuarii]MCM2372407.1 hypothetical protein [Aporhodopirellula aestuarii]